MIDWLYKLFDSYLRQYGMPSYLPSWAAASY